MYRQSDRILQHSHIERIQVYFHTHDDLGNCGGLVDIRQHLQKDNLNLMSMGTSFFKETGSLNLVLRLQIIYDTRQTIIINYLNKLNQISAILIMRYLLIKPDNRGPRT